MALTAAPIVDLLQRRIALLTGGRDPTGGPIITFPSHNPSEQFTPQDIIDSVAYLANIPSEDSAGNGFTLLIDNTQGYWRDLKYLLGPIEQVLGRQVKAVFVLISPDGQFRQSFRGNRLNYHVEPQQTTPQKLMQIINPSEIQREYGGLLPYHHEAWIQNRLDYERFLHEVHIATENLRSQSGEIMDRGHRNKSKHELLQHHYWLQDNVFKEPEKVIKEGRDIHKRMYREPDPNTLDGSQYTLDEVMMMNHIRYKVEQIEKMLDLFTGDWRNEQPPADTSNNFDVANYEQAMKTVVDWILGPADKILSSQTEIGDSFKTADQCRKEHEKFEIKCTETYSMYAEIRHKVQDLVDKGHPKASDLDAQKNYMDTVCRSFALRLERRRNLVITSVRYHRLAEELSSMLDDLFKEVCTEVNVQSIEQAEELLRNLNTKCDTIGVTGEQTFNEGQNLLDQLSLPVKNSSGKDITPNNKGRIVHIEQTTERLQERKMRCDELADVRKLKLQQILQMLQLERDADRAIAWIQELCEAASQIHINIRENPRELDHHQRELDKLEHTAQSTYNYGKQLLEAALVLRRSLNYDLEPNHERMRRLNYAWKRFNQGVSEHTARMNAAAQFHQNANYVIERIEELLVTTTETINIQNLVQKYSQDKDRVGHDYRETMAEGQQLLDRLHRPVVAAMQNGDTDMASDEEISEEVKVKMNTMTDKYNKLEQCWQDKTGGIHLNERGELVDRWGKIIVIEEKIVTTTTTRNSYMPAPPRDKGSEEWAQLERLFRESNDWIRVRIQQMEPDLMEVGSNLEEARHLRREHEELLRKLHQKQGEVRELLSRADDMAVQDRSRQEVYTAMAESLNEAWKDLNAQLEYRTMLLDQSIAFHESAVMFSNHMEDAQQHFTSMGMAHDVDTARRLLQQHQELKKSILEASMQTLQEGQALLDRIREMGMHADVQNRHATTAACYGIEHLLELLQDRRRHLEELWLQRKIKLEQRLQLLMLDQEVKKVSDWFTNTGDAYLSRKDLGDSLEAARALQDDQIRFEHQAREIQETVLRLIRTADQLVHSAHYDAEGVKQRLQQVDSRCEDFMNRLDMRRKNLALSVSFFTLARTALSKLDEIEVQLTSTDLPRNSAALAQQHAYLNNAIVEVTTPALQEGSNLLERVRRDEPGTQGVQNKVDELRERTVKLQDLCLARYEAGERSQAYNQFQDKFNNLSSWFGQVGEATLSQNNDLGSNLSTARDFLEAHERLEENLRSKGPQIDALAAEAAELSKSGGEEAAEAENQVKAMREQWNLLLRLVEQRIKLALKYVAFHKKVQTLAIQIDALEQYLKIEKVDATQIADSAIQHKEQKYSEMNSQFSDVENQGKTFITDAKDVRDDRHLDTRRAIVTVETIINQFSERKFMVTEYYEHWKVHVTTGRDFKNQWDQFVKEARKTIDWIMKAEKDLFVPYISGKLGKSLEEAEKLQKKLDDFAPTAKKAQDEIEGHLKTAEMLSLKGDTHGQRDQIVNELLRVHTRFQARISEYQVLLNMTINFFKNLHKLDKLIEETEKEYNRQELPNEVTKATLMLKEHEANKGKMTQLIDYSHEEGDAIVVRVRQQDSEAIAKDEVQKVLGLTENRRNTWEHAWEDRKLKLEQNLQVCQFYFDLRQIHNELDELHRQLNARRGNYGSSLTSAQMTSEAFKNFEMTVQVIEKKIQTFVSTAEMMIRDHHYDSRRIRHEVDEVQKKWAAFYITIGEYRDSLDVSTKFFQLMDQCDATINEASQTLLQFGRKAVECKTSEDANALIKQLEDFKNNFANVQDGRLQEMENIAVQLWGPVHGPQKMQHLVDKNQEILSSFIKAVDELSILRENLFKKEQILVEMSTVVETHAPQVPRFVVPLQNTEIMEGQRFTFECRLQCDTQTPKIEWFKDEMPLTSPDYLTGYKDGMCTLTIEETFSEDSAKYTCKATTDKGSAETSATLKVRETHQKVRAPDFTKHLKSADAPEGSQFVFECYVTGTPGPSISWFKDDVCVDNNPDFVISQMNGSCTLKIRKVNKSHSARYTCKANNPGGEAASSARLNAISVKKPYFHEPLKNISVEEGKSAKLECQYSGEPAPHVQWLKNGQPLMPSNTFKITIETNFTTLEIRQVFPEDAGSYTVVAKNLGGDTRTTCQITIEGVQMDIPDAKPSTKPMFRQRLVDKDVNEGSRARLDVVITAYPQPEVLWFHNDNPVKESKDFQLLFEGDKCSLVIKEVYLEDSGEYKCTARNKIGQAECRCRLIVDAMSELSDASVASVASEVVPPKFTQLLKDVEGTEGMKVRFDCRVIGHPTPDVKWYRGRQEVKSSADFQITSSRELHSLTIPETFQEDAGNFMVKATNAAGEAKCYATLTVKQTSEKHVMKTRLVEESHLVQKVVQVGHTPPEFTKLFKDMRARPGEPCTLQVLIQGNPRPKVQWLFNNYPVVSPDYQISSSGDTYTLHIPEVFDEDAGRFSVTAENDSGKATCSALLVVVDESQAGINGDIVSPPETPFSKIAPAQVAPVAKAPPPPPPPKPISPAPSPIPAQVRMTPSPTPQWAPRLAAASPIPKGYSPVSFQPRVPSPVPVAQAPPPPPPPPKEPSPKPWTPKPVSPAPVMPEKQQPAKWVPPPPPPKPKAPSPAFKQQAPKPVDLTVSMPIPPKFLESLKNMSAEEGTKVSFSGIVDGKPQPTIKWFKEGREISDRPDYQVSYQNGRVCLIIPEVFEEDAGKYLCKASNTGGDAQSTAELIVKASMTPPQFLERIRANHVKEADSVKFTVRVTGKPPPEVTWYREGSQIVSSPDFEVTQEGDLHTLIIPEVFYEDAGKFTVRADNKAGQAECSAQLIVDAALPEAPPMPPPAPVAPPMTRPADATPVFKNALVNQPLKPGQTAHFECQVQGFPPPEILWTRKGHPLVDKFRYKSTYDQYSGITTLTILNLCTEDEGEYTCTAINDIGEASTSATLLGPDRYAAWLAENQGAQPPQKPIAPEQTQPVYRPMSDTEPDQGFKVSNFETRLSKEVDYRDGKVAPQHHTSDTEAFMDVPTGQAAAPKFDQKLKDFKLIEGSDATFVAKVSGNPMPSIQWFQNGRLIRPSNRYEMKMTKDGYVSLRVRVAFPEDTGHFTCCATNLNGRETCSSELYVEGIGNIDETSYVDPETLRRMTKRPDEDRGPRDRGGVSEKYFRPHFRKIPTDQNIPEGKMCRFDSVVSGRPMPEIFWYRDGQQVHDDNLHKIVVNEDGIHSLIIHITQKFDAGQYICIARNRGGEDQFTVHLNVLPRETTAPPRFTERMSNQAVKQGQPVDFEAEASGIPAPMMSWQKDGRHIENSDLYQIDTQGGRSHLHITHASPNDSTWFQCSAVNVAGTATNRARLTVAVERKIEPERKLVIPKRTTPTPPLMETAEKSFSPIQFEPVKLYDGTPSDMVKIRPHTSPPFEKRHSLTTPPPTKPSWMERKVVTPPPVSTKPSWVKPAYREPSPEVTDFGPIFAPSPLVKPLSPPEPMEQQPFEPVTASDKEAPKKARADITLTPTPTSESPTPWRSVAAPRASQPSPQPTDVRPPWDQPDAAPMAYAPPAPVEPTKIASQPVSVQMAAPKPAEPYKPQQSDLLKYIADEDKGTPDLKPVPIREPGVRPSTQDLIKQGVIPAPEEADMYSRDQARPPQFKTQIKAQMGIEQAKPSHFECRLVPIGDPTMKVEWFKDGQLIRHGSRFMPVYDFGFVALDLLWTYPEDNGTYTCRATNKYGEDTTSAEIRCMGDQSVIYDSQLPDGDQSMAHIQSMEDSIRRENMRRERPDEGPEPSAPIFDLMPEPSEVEEGDTAKFMCKVGGHPRPRVTWWVNGAIIVNGHRFQLRYDGMIHVLEIPKVREYDQGTIRVVAKNPLGEAECSTTLVVLPREDWRSRLRHAPKSTVEVELQGVKTPDHRTDELVGALRKPKTTVVEIRAFERATQEKVQTYRDDEVKQAYHAINLQHASMQRTEASKELRQHEPNVRISSEQHIERAKHMLDMMHEPMKTEERKITKMATKSAVPPTFTKPLMNITSKEGNAVKMEVNYSGFPSPDIAWFREGVEIQPSRDFQITVLMNKSFLLIPEVFPEDAGLFTVKATNQFGMAECKANLKVTEDVGKSKDSSPEFKVQMRDITVCIGEPATFDVQVSGIPKPDVYWTKDGKQIYESPRWKFIIEEEHYTLLIYEVTVHDKGTYECNVINKQGKATCRAKLEVEGQVQAPKAPEPAAQRAPQLVSALKDAQVNEGETVQFQCKIQATPDPVVTWYYNNQVIKPSKYFQMTSQNAVHILIIAGAFPEDEGIYKCTARNQAGEVTCIAHLRVLALSSEPEQEIQPQMEPPRFTRPISGHDVTEGQEARFEAITAGVPPPQITWYREGTQIPNSEDFQITSDGNKCSLYIKEVLIEDAGIFTCRATNPAGVAECSAELFVQDTTKVSQAQVSFAAPPGPQPQPPSLLKAPSPTREVIVGNTTKLVVHVAAYPPPRFNWFINGLEMTPSQRYKVNYENGVITLIIFNVQPGDAGEYVLKAANDMGEITCKTVLNIKPTEKVVELPADTQEVTITQTQKTMRSITRTEVQPTFVAPLQPEVRAKVGGVAQLECHVQAVPQPKITWHVNGLEIKPSPKYTINLEGERSILLIKNLAAEDSGVYSCRAVSELGEAVCSTTLYVSVSEAKTESPKFTVPLSSAAACDGKEVTLPCTVQGLPMPDIYWYHNDKNIDKSEDFVINYDRQTGVINLVIVDCLPDDAGVFKCIARNDAGEAVTQATLIVNPAPQRPQTDEIVPMEVEPVQVAPPPAEEKITVEHADVQIVKRSSVESLSSTTSSTKDVKVIKKIVKRTSGQPPKFTKPIQPQVVREGDTAQFEAIVLAAPVPEIAWLKDKVELVKTERHITSYDETTGTCTLQILNAQAPDIGVYSCRASNCAGKATCTANVVVVPPDAEVTITEKTVSVKKEKVTIMGEQETRQVENSPTFTQPLMPQTQAKEGDTVTLETVMEAEPQPTVTWLHNGKEIISTSRITITFDGRVTKLTILNITVEDAGEYICKSINPLGQGTTKTILIVQRLQPEPVPSTAQPTPQDAPQPVTNGDVIPEQVPQAQAPPQQGPPADVPLQEPCAVIQEAPRFTLPLCNQAVNDGDRCVFKVFFRGIPSPTITWYFNSQPIKQSRDFQINIDSKKGESTLIIVEVFPEDEGEYMCKAENTLGCAVTHCHLFVKLPSSSEDEEGTERIVSKTTEVVKTTEPVSIKEKRRFSETIAIDHQSKLRAQEFQFTLPKPTISRSELYYQQPAQPKPVKMEVDIPQQTSFSETKIIELKRKAEALLAQPLQLQPPIKQQRRFSETLTIDQTRITPVELTFRLPEEQKQVAKSTLLVRRDSVPKGVKMEVEVPQYRRERSLVEVQRQKQVEAIDTVRQEFQLQLEGSPPKFIWQLNSLKVMDGEEARYVCRVAGNPMPEISWYHNGKVVVDNPDFRTAYDRKTGECVLHILEVFPQDTGKYECVAVNKYGKAVTRATLLVEVFEYVPDSEEATASQTESIVSTSSIDEVDFQAKTQRFLENMERLRKEIQEEEVGQIYQEELVEEVEVEEQGYEETVQIADVKWQFQKKVLPVTERVSPEKMEEGIGAVLPEKSREEEITVDVSTASIEGAKPTLVQTQEAGERQELTLEISAEGADVMQEEEITIELAQPSVKGKEATRVMPMQEAQSEELAQDLVATGAETMPHEEIKTQLDQPTVLDKTESRTEKVQETVDTEISQEIVLQTEETTQEQEITIELAAHETKAKTESQVEPVTEQVAAEAGRDLSQSPVETTEEQEITVELAAPEVQEKQPTEVVPVTGDVSEEISMELIAPVGEQPHEEETVVELAQPDVEQKQPAQVAPVEEKVSEEIGQDLLAAPEEKTQEEEIQVELKQLETTEVTETQATVGLTEIKQEVSAEIQITEEEQTKEDETTVTLIESKTQEKEETQAAVGLTEMQQEVSMEIQITEQEQTKEEETIVTLAASEAKPKEETQAAIGTTEMPQEVSMEIQVTEQEQTKEDEIVVTLAESEAKPQETTQAVVGLTELKHEVGLELQETETETTKEEETVVSLGQPETTEKEQVQVVVAVEEVAPESHAEITEQTTEETKEEEITVELAEAPKQITESQVAPVEEQVVEETGEELAQTVEETTKEEEISVDLAAQEQKLSAESQVAPVEEKVEAEVGEEIFLETTEEPVHQEVDETQMAATLDEGKQETFLETRVEEVAEDSFEKVRSVSPEQTKEEEIVVDLSAPSTEKTTESLVQQQMEVLSEESPEGEITEMVSETTKEEEIVVDLSQPELKAPEGAHVQPSDEHVTEELADDIANLPSPTVPEGQEIPFDFSQTEKPTQEETHVQHLHEILSEGEVEDNIGELTEEMTKEEEVKVDLSASETKPMEESMVGIVEERQSEEEEEEIFYEAPEPGVSGEDVPEETTTAEKKPREETLTSVLEEKTSVELTEESAAEFTEEKPGEEEIRVDLDAAVKDIPEPTLVSQVEESTDVQETREDVKELEEEQTVPEDVTVDLTAPESLDRPPQRVEKVNEEQNPELVAEEYGAHLKEVYMIPSVVAHEFEPSVVEKYRFETKVRPQAKKEQTEETTVTTEISTDSRQVQEEVTELSQLETTTKSQVRAVQEVVEERQTVTETSTAQIEVIERTEIDQQEKFVSETQTMIESQPTEKTITTMALMAPVFEIPLSDVTVSDGERAVLQCRVTGVPRPEITWYIDAQEVKESSEIRITYEENMCTLEILDVLAEDEGEYTVKAVNEAGTCVTTAYLTVLPPSRPDSEAESPVVEEPLVRTEKEVTVRTRTGEEVVEEKKKVEIDVSLQKRETTEMTVVMKEVTKTVELQAPKFISTLEPKEIFESLPVTLQCEVSGNPVPEITWYQDGKKIESTEHKYIQYLDGVCSLSIDKCTLEDEAEYKCEAKNEGGMASTMAQLLIEKLISAVEQVIFEEYYEIQIEMHVKWRTPS